jgi:hypothetical protein
MPRSVKTWPKKPKKAELFLFLTCNAPSKLACFPLERWRLVRLQLREHSHPPRPCARRDVRFAHASTTLNDPSKLARSPHGGGWSSNCDFAMDAGPYRCGRHSHPPNPWASFPPTDPPIALQSFTQDAPFSQAAMARPCSKARSNDPSKLACTSLLRGRLGCFQLRASTSTAYLKTRLVWCARWASKGSCLAYPFTILRSQAAIGPCGLIHR